MYNKHTYNLLQSLDMSKGSRLIFIKHIYLFFSRNISISWPAAEHNLSTSYNVAVCCCSRSSCHSNTCSAVMRFYRILPASVQSQSPQAKMYCCGLRTHIRTHTHTQKMLKFDPVTLFLEMYPLFCPPLWGKDRNGWMGKKRESERELLLTLGGKRESHGQYYNHKSCPLVFSVDESKILCSNQSPLCGTHLNETP